MNTRSIYAVIFFVLSGHSYAYADNNNNVSSIDQIGTTIAAETIQEGTSNANISDIDQGLGAPSDVLTAFVTQGGNANHNGATVKQDGSDAYADILQGGDTNFNTADIIQDGMSNEAFVTQDGSNNTNGALVHQTGTGDLNSAVITQGGNSNTNTAGISQNGSGLIGSTIQN
jgi:hypothetical protein